MASGARTLRKTPSISRAGKVACGKGVSHGVFLDSWVGEGDQRSRSGAVGSLLSRWCGCGPTGHLPSITAHSCDGRRGGWRGEAQGCRAWCALSYLPGVQRGQKCSSGRKEQGEAPDLQAQCLPQPWEHVLEGICCKPTATSLVGRQNPSFPGQRPWNAEPFLL